jgi:hypothetical protein
MTVQTVYLWELALVAFPLGCWAARWWIRGWEGRG